MVTGEHDGQVGHAEEPASTRAAGELETPANATTGLDTAGTGTTAAGELVSPASTGAGAAEVAGVGVARTAGVEDAPASMGLGVDTNGTGTTAGVLRAGQFLTVGAQLVRTSLMVLKAVASTTGGEAAVTCS